MEKTDQTTYLTACWADIVSSALETRRKSPQDVRSDRTCEEVKLPGNDAEAAFEQKERGKANEGDQRGRTNNVPPHVNAVDSTSTNLMLVNSRSI